MSQFDAETAVVPVGEGPLGHLLVGRLEHRRQQQRRLRADVGSEGLCARWCPIPTRSRSPPHFLRPARGDTDAEVKASVVRSGRTVSTLRGSLWQEGKQRLEVLAAFSDLAAGDAGPEIAQAPPTIPPVEDCVHRGSLEQGVELPILSRVDVHVHPDHAPAGGSDRALIDGWIRFSDGAAPSTMALPFFADALPPSLYPLLGFIGWVPTIELTVHARRAPAPGWLQVRQESHDLHDGRMIESGSLWDSTGALVAASRQIGLLLT